MDKIRIADIKIGERRREDLGDIEALARSIEKYGLLAPPVLTDDGTLVAGQRRVEAMKRLGWTETPYINKGELTQAQLHEIELEENIRRKDFTEYEISKNMTELAKAVGERLRNESCITVIQNPLGGPKVKADSIRAIAKEIGVPHATVQHAQEHVSAVETYPVLEALPKMKAISVAKQADKLPEEQRGPFTAEQAATLKRDLKQLNDEATIAKKFINALGNIRTIEITQENVRAWVSFEKMDRDEITEARGDIRECIRRYSEIDKILEDMMKLRIVN